MIRPGLLDWQWRDYSDKHRSRTNLLLHIVAVPLFQIGSAVFVWALFARSDVGVSRFVVEQWVTFPRFVFSGAWRRNLKLSREG